MQDVHFQMPISRLHGIRSVIELPIYSHCTGWLESPTTCISDGDMAVDSHVPSAMADTEIDAA